MKCKNCSADACNKVNRQLGYPLNIQLFPSYPINHFTPPRRTPRKATAMRTPLIGLAVLFVAGLAQSAESAVVSIDFTDGVYSKTGFPNPGGGYDDTYTEDGFQFITPNGNHFDSSLASGYLHFHEGGDNTAENIVRLTFSGGLFDLSSITLRSGTPTPNSARIDLTSSSGAMATIGPAPGLVNITGFTNVTWVDFNISSATFGDAVFENVTLNGAPVTPTVGSPEPASFVLFGLGALGMATGAVRRRRKCEG
jgi:hypothetical protein